MIENHISARLAGSTQRDWGFTVVLDVYNPHYYKPESPIWVAESDTEEAQRPKPKLLESRPKTKARATSSRATAEEVEQIEEEGRSSSDNIGEDLSKDRQGAISEGEAESHSSGFSCFVREGRSG